MNRPDVTICDVGLRDGLQISKDLMPVAQKTAWLAAQVAAGMRAMEVTSFVPARLMPQFADAADVITFANALPGLQIAQALAPNFRGCERAVAAGARAISVPVSASAEHSLANVRKTTDEQIAEVLQMAALRGSLPADQSFKLVAGISTAFGCTIQGEVPEQEVIRVALALKDAGVDALAICDTVGYAHPRQVKRLFTAVRAAVGDAIELQAHFHNTRGLGLANCMAAYETGVRYFDATLGGLGGCPHAPGASGNVVTEDLAYMFEAMGISTGIDLDKLAEVRAMIRPQLPQTEFFGHFAMAGKAKTFPNSMAIK